jgi:hypothetical protein
VVTRGHRSQHSQLGLFEREYRQRGKNLSMIAAETGFSRKNPHSSCPPRRESPSARHANWSGRRIGKLQLV